MPFSGEQFHYFHPFLTNKLGIVDLFKILILKIKLKFRWKFLLLAQHLLGYRNPAFPNLYFHQEAENHRNLSPRHMRLIFNVPAVKRTKKTEAYTLEEGKRHDWRF